jgi:Na+-driven multidrug efflux pump
VGSTIFQALGKALPAFITSLARPAIFLIPLIFILAQVWQLNGVWLAFPITDALACGLTAVLLVPIVKQLQEMSRSQAAAIRAPIPSEGK